jgi:hypothetical protein
MTDPDPKEAEEPGKVKPSGEKPSEEKPLAEADEPTADEKNSRPWVRPVIAGVALLLVAGAAGFGIGYSTRSGDSGPDLTGREAFVQAREQTLKKISREMARRGFDAGRKSGRSHGIIAGGMAAESAVTIIVREQQTAAAQEAAASAQSELAGMAGSPPPIPTPDEG